MHISNRDYIRESKFHDIEKLIDDSSLDKLLKEQSSEKDYLSKVEELDEEIFTEDDTFPGSFSITLDGMAMNAYLEMIDSVNCECEVSMPDVVNEIRSMGSFFNSRVNWEEVDKLYDSVFNDHMILPPVLIATGLKVEPNIPEHIILKESLTIDYKPMKLKDGSVDYHSINSFIYVKAGEYLGDFIPDQIGVNGMALNGAIIPAPTMVVNNYTIGKNVDLKGDKIYSKISGTYKLADNIIDVEPCLEIGTDVDYHTGDIEYKGDINILGTIREGFSVASDGDIFISGSIEPSDITCGNNLYVQEGIVGSDEYTVYCDASLYAIHIENAKVKAHGNINIKNSISKSRLYSLDKILMPKNGVIIGGELYSQNGIIAGSIGNKNSVSTNIYLGVDYEVQNKLKVIRNTIDELIVKMAELQEALPAAKTREEKEKIKFLFTSLQDKVNGLHNYSRTLLGKIDKNDSATLEVYGTVYPGTHIEICHVSLDVKDKLNSVRFSLNKEKGEVVIEYLY